MLIAAGVYGYQSHVKTEVEFSSGINAFIGGSDEGKSAFVRALRWAIENKPLGDGFINWDFKPKDILEVTLEFSEEVFIARQKNRSTSQTVNQYTISSHDDPLKALRTGVPDEVTQITKMDETNIQKQQSWFLLNEKPGIVAKSFNKLAALGVMDESIRIVNVDIREEESRYKIFKNKWEVAVENLNSFSEWFTPAEKEFDLLMNDYDIIKDIRKEVLQLDELITKDNILTAKLGRFHLLDKCSASLKTLRKESDALQVVKAEHKKLTALTENADKLDKKIKQYVDIDSCTKTLYVLLREQKQMADLLEGREALAKVLLALEEIEEQLPPLELEIEETEKKMDQILKKLGLCPTCRRKI